MILRDSENENENDMNDAIERLNSRLENGGGGTIVEIRNALYDAVWYEWSRSVGSFLPPICAQPHPCSQTILTRLSAEAHEMLLSLPVSSRRPLGESCLFHPDLHPLRRPSEPFPPPVEMHPILIEPVPSGVRGRILGRLNRSEHWLANNSVRWRSETITKVGVVPFLSVRHGSDRYFMLTCLSPDADVLYHIRIPYVFGPQTVGVRDDDEYFLGVSIDADPPTRVRFYDEGWSLDYEDDALVPATDCCVLSMWLAGFIESPSLSRYVNLAHNEAGRFETVASSFGDDLIVERMIRSIVGPVLPREIVLPTNPALPSSIMCASRDTLMTLYASPMDRRCLCYFAIDVVNRGRTHQRKALYRLFDSLGLRREPHSVAMLFINEHALVLTHTGTRYECLELQIGYRQEAYDYLILRNRGQAYLYFYLTPERRVSMEGPDAETLRSFYDPFRSRRTVAAWLREAYREDEPKGDREDPEPLRLIKAACILSPRLWSDRRMDWERVARLLPEFTAWSKADESIAEHYLPEWIETVGSEIAYLYPHLVIDFHLAVSTGAVKRSECISMYRSRFET